MLSDEDMWLFRNDPNEFIRKNDGGDLGMLLDPRESAISLLQALGRYRQKDTLPGKCHYYYYNYYCYFHLSYISYIYTHTYTTLLLLSFLPLLQDMINTFHSSQESQRNYRMMDGVLVAVGTLAKIMYESKTYKSLLGMCV